MGAHMTAAAVDFVYGPHADREDGHFSSRWGQATRAPVILVGGKVADRLALARRLHRAGRTWEAPFLALEDDALRHILERTLLRGISWLAPATLYMDRAEAFDRELCTLVAAVARRSDDEWRRPDHVGLRVMAGVRSKDYLHPAVMELLDVLCIQVGEEPRLPVQGAERHPIWK